MVSALLIGVGNTGRIVVDNLIRSRKVDTIYLYNRRNFKVDHMVEELSAIDPRKKIIVIERDGHNIYPIKFLKNPNLVFICASDYRSDQRAEEINKSTIDLGVKMNFRMAELKQNKRVMKDVALLLKDLKDSSIFVVSNPVDIFTNFLALRVDKSNNIYGFGLALDLLRARHILRNKGFSTDKVHKFVCIANHGDPVPLFSKVMKNPRSSLYVEFQKSLRKHFVKSSFSGITYFQWSLTLADLVHGALGEKNFETGLAVKANNFEGVKGIHIGLPVKFSGGKVKVVDNFTLSSLERKLFFNKVKGIKEEVDSLRNL